ncbi:MAG: TolC family protein [Candidatus Polarisedimenticolia bacterium]
MLGILIWSAFHAASPEPLDLASLLEQARQRNPAIAAARGRQAAAEAVPSQVEALPDPMASIAYTNESLDDITLGDSVDSFLALSWLQELPYPGKRRLAGDVARREADGAALGVSQRELEIAARVKQVYADLYRLDRTASILDESRFLLSSLLDATRARYEAGEGLLQNVLKAQTEIAVLEAQGERIHQERGAAAARMRALVGDTDRLPLGPATALPDTVAELDAAALEAEALARSPVILQAQAAVGAGEARLELARKDLKPDFSYGAGYSYRGDLDPMVMGMFGVRLPLYRQNKQAQGVVQASAEVDAAVQDLAATRLEIAAEVQELASRADRAARLITIYEQSILPQARSALESSSVAYGVGRVDFLTLLNDFSSLFRSQLDLEAQKAERVSALAALERLTALPLVQSGTAGPAGEARP